MKYYFIEPVNQFSPSRRWFTDEHGLEGVKFRYENYGHNPSEYINRWTDFKVTEVKTVKVDFGGMCSLDEPHVRVKDGKNGSFKMMVSHLPIFVACLEDFREDLFLKDMGIGCISMRWWNICLSLETASRILPKAKKLLENCEEMLEGAERDFQLKLEEIQKKGGKIISLRKKRKKKND